MAKKFSERMAMMARVIKDAQLGRFDSETSRKRFVSELDQ